MMQASLLNVDVDKRILFLFVYGLLQINFTSELLEIPAVGFKVLFENQNLSLLLFRAILFTIDL